MSSSPTLLGDRRRRVNPLLNWRRWLSPRRWRSRTPHAQATIGPPPYTVERQRRVSALLDWRHESRYSDLAVPDDVLKMLADAGWTPADMEELDALGYRGDVVRFLLRAMDTLKICPDHSPWAIRLWTEHFVGPNLADWESFPNLSQIDRIRCLARERLRCESVIADWYEVIGARLAPYARAAGLNRYEAADLAAQGKLTFDSLAALIALRGCHVPAPRLRPLPDDPVSPPAT